MLRVKGIFSLTVLAGLFVASPAMAVGNFQAPADFINEVFNHSPPKAKVLWLNKKHKVVITTMLAHPYPTLRLRYWQQGNKSAWIVNEVGKEKPITFGIVVNDKHIEQLKVLSFRESRGGEIRHNFFTKQFLGLHLTEDKLLNKPIDGISGATLSVNAANKMARLALYLHQQVSQP